jgi:hypothetical protein
MERTVSSIALLVVDFKFGSPFSHRLMLPLDTPDLTAKTSALRPISSKVFFITSAIVAFLDTFVYKNILF